jgi:hypothetical protein
MIEHSENSLALHGKNGENSLAPFELSLSSPLVNRAFYHINLLKNSEKSIKKWLTLGQNEPKISTMLELVPN